jgi:hypothetical protein
MSVGPNGGVHICAGLFRDVCGSAVKFRIAPGMYGNTQGCVRGVPGCVGRFQGCTNMCREVLECFWRCVGVHRDVWGCEGDVVRLDRDLTPEAHFASFVSVLFYKVTK